MGNIYRNPAKVRELQDLIKMKKTEINAKN